MLGGGSARAGLTLQVTGRADPRCPSGSSELFRNRDAISDLFLELCV